MHIFYKNWFALEAIATAGLKRYTNKNKPYALVDVGGCYQKQH